HVVYHGCDLKRFQPLRRNGLREAARAELGLRPAEFTLLLIGNDWKKKGLRCLLEATALLANEAIHVLVVGKDNVTPFRGILEQSGLAGRVQFLPPRSDVEIYYAAADLYVGPSLEDAFALPPLEAMACGLPVIVSRQAGVSELIHHAEDGLVLEDPEDATILAKCIQRLADDTVFRRALAANAARTAQTYTWESNGGAMRVLFEKIIHSRKYN
ncbi:MAG: glycosyltransferase family 4 protein, partial [Candidatus Acidiferrales bacterium]